jgi:predicted secreted acid phosphatase
VKNPWRWCGLSSAEALPGALDFTNLAAELGFDVYYISNRGESSEATSINKKDALNFYRP